MPRFRPPLLGEPHRKMRVFTGPGTLHPDFKLVDAIPPGPHGKFERRSYRHANGFVVEIEWIPEAESGLVKAMTPEQAMIQAVRWAREFEANPPPAKIFPQRPRKK